MRKAPKRNENTREERVCHNPECRMPLLDAVGPRARLYCDDTCKQKAYRIRQKAMRITQREVALHAQFEQERSELHRRFGNFLPETFDLLQSVSSGTLLEQIVRAIRAEQERVRQTFHQERISLIEHLLLLGEELDFPLLKNDDFRLEEGFANWIVFCEMADVEQLYVAYDIAHIKLQGRNARTRLTQLSSQS